MRIYDIIEKKKTNKELTSEEIYYFIENYSKGIIPDYQASALLMAIYFNGMTPRERLDLTMAMMYSGDMLDLSKIEGIKVDKHSTGGVGDKVTLVLAPIVASLGVPVAKMSGRGLGHTGGTIDKLESFTGFNTSLSEDEFIHLINTSKIAITGQSHNLAPADKKLYALRDLTATVDEISLITSSIMSKKLAAGTDAIVLDVTVGDGAFMKTISKAKELATAMVEIGKRSHREIAAILTNMEEPLGYAIGNILEVKEAIEALKGNGPSDLMEVVFELGAQMIVFSKIASTKEIAKEMMLKNIKNGKALAKLKELIENQHGDCSFIDNPDKFPSAKDLIEVKAASTGYIHQLKAEAFGLASMMLGGGRETLEDTIDMTVGIILNHKIGDYVNEGDLLYTIHSNNKEKAQQATETLQNAVIINSSPCKPSETILDIII